MEQHDALMGCVDLCVRTGQTLAKEAQQQAQQRQQAEDPKKVNGPPNSVTGAVDQ